LEAQTMPLQMDRLDSDVFLFRGRQYDSGSLVVTSGRDALLVDGLGSLDDADRLRTTLVHDWGKRVVFLVSTHYFSDHIAAWNLFPEASVIAHQNALQTFWTEDFRTLEETSHFRPPTLLLSGRLELSWGRHRIEIFENLGHTAGTLNVDLPEADLLHVADNAVGRLAYIHYSAPEAIDRALARAQARGRRRIVRSHGPVVGPDVLQSARHYLRNLGRRVAEARRARTPIASIRADDCLPPGEPASEFEAFFHSRNLASIEVRGLFAEAA
jgi:glyoxylase-like metal-dependent hydrolase (beta-lactamase superfamily II)